MLTADGDPAPLLPVSWHSNDAAVHAQTTTDAEGRFSLPGVQTGPGELDLGSLTMTDGRAQYPAQFLARGLTSFSESDDDLTLTLPRFNAVRVHVAHADYGGTVTVAENFAVPGNYQDACTEDYEMFAGADSSCAQNITNGRRGDHFVDANGNTTVLFVANPEFHAFLEAHDVDNSARTARSPVFTADTTDRVLISLPVRPSAPRAPDATGGIDTGEVTWAPPASDGGSDLTGYTVTAARPCRRNRSAAAQAAATAAVVPCTSARGSGRPNSAASCPAPATPSRSQRRTRSGPDRPP